MAMSEQVKQSVKNANFHIREALSFAARGNEDIQVVVTLTNILNSLESFDTIEMQIEGQKQFMNMIRKNMNMEEDS